MSEAKALLDSLTDAELAEYSTGPVNDVLTIDAEKRTIDVPGTELLLGVITDKDVERKYFKCPRIVGDNIDLSKLSLRIPFINANNETDAYIVEDLEVIGDYITFSWLLSEKVLTYKGEVQFAVCAVKALDDGTLKNVWNTTMATGTVLNGIPAINIEAEEEDRVRDVISQLLAIVENQKDEAIEEIEEAAAQIISTIPEDYQTTYKLVRSKANAIEGIETGEVISASDASDNELMGLRIFGKTTQAATPTPDAPQDLVNIENPTAYVYGKNICVKNLSIGTENVTIADFGKDVHFDALTFSIYLENASVTSNGSAFINFQTSNNTNRYVTCGEVGMVNGTSYTKRIYKTVEDVTCRRIICYFKSNEYGKWSGIVKNAQLEIGANVTDYEPHMEEQRITFTVPNGLPGVPVTDASIATYTDKNGQMWVADEIDCEKGVYIQRVSDITVSTGYIVDLATGAKGLVVDLPPQKIKQGGTGLLCTYAPFDPMRTMSAGSLYENALNVVFCGTSSDTLDTLLAKYTNASIMYILATPIETPLSTAEIRAYQKLHTNKPNTTILNNVGATMQVNYGKDTKMYFDSLYNAIINGSEVEW